MQNLYFPICGFFCIILVVVLFYSKEKVNTIETKIYGFMILSSLFDILIGLVIILLGLKYNSSLNLFVMILNKIDFIHYILWPTLLFLYIFYISIDDKSKYDIVKKVISILDVIFVIVELVLPIELININDTMGVVGLGSNFVYIVAILYFVSSSFIVFTTIRKKFSRKYIPFVILLFMLGIVCVVRVLNPTLIVIPTIIVYINLIMYFTIENPDVKLVNELRIAREQAEKANRAKTDFLSSMSHEIRTPLNAIVGFSDCIMESNDIGEAKENARDIVSASQTLLEIVNGILDISKIEAGKIEIVNSKYNGHDAFIDLAKLITPKMNEKGLDFTYSIAEDIPNTLYGDHANIKKIVTNLLSNACKYTDKGFVHYEVNCVNTKDVCKLIISVEDSGRGIKKENIDKMFTKFQRLDEDRNTTIEGTGLGLAITKQLIELMGGKIIVHTVYGEGSKFTVVLNQRIETADEEVQKKVKSTLDLKDVRILMVDDTPLNLKVASKLLEKYNANHIVTCNSGFECLERIQKGEVYDVILLDDMMPKMSGVETFLKLKEILGFNIPTVALTANAITGMREKYLADGFNDYLAKPIEKDELIRVMNEILGRTATEEIRLSEIKETANVQIRDNIIVNDSYKDKIIPVDENIEQQLGNKLDLTSKIEVKNINTIPVVDINDIKPVQNIDVSNIKPIETLESNNTVYDRTYLENNGVDVEHGLELLGDMEMYNMTINDFMAEVEDKWSRICEYKESSDMENYAIEVHSLKSDCKYLGFMTLADIAYQHELKSKEKDVTFVNNNFNSLETEYKKVLEIARNYVNHNPVND